MPGFFKRALERVKDGLSKTRRQLTSTLKAIFTAGRKIDQELLEELEACLLAADLGVRTTQQLIEEIQEANRQQKMKEATEIYGFLKERLKAILSEAASIEGECTPEAGPLASLRTAPTPPTVILVAGVNGTGKTTSIAKLGQLLKKEGNRVVLAASDTFRAAAIEQLSIWSERIGVDLIRHQQNADPGAVAYDAAEAAVARGADFLIVDTAGRLHTKKNLMRELEKIRNVLRKKIPGAPHEVLLVLDATTGQNAISQATMFKEAIDVTGLFLAKLDGTAKGGIVIAIRTELDLPVKFIGLGETPEDIERFDTETFVEALFA